jgi:hypothetical protein
MEKWSIFLFALLLFFFFGNFATKVAFKLAISSTLGGVKSLQIAVLYLRFVL